MGWTLQGSDEIVVNAPPDRIWDILEDGPRLPEWMPIVKRKTGQREIMGAERSCEVEFGSKAGRVVERCVESVPRQRIAWRMEEDTFGFSRMLADIGFSFTLDPQDDGTTLLRNESYYRPKTLASRIMSALMMKRKFHRVRETALRNLKRLAEKDPLPARDQQHSTDLSVAAS